jgi:hypothetical protein
MTQSRKHVSSILLHLFAGWQAATGHECLPADPQFRARVVRSANDYRILVTTEVLAEGVSLHRANVVLNYDIHWKGREEGLLSCFWLSLYLGSRRV